MACWSCWAVSRLGEVGGVEGGLKEVLDNSDGDGKFGFHFGVFFEESSQGLVEARPAGETMSGD